MSSERREDEAHLERQVDVYSLCLPFIQPPSPPFMTFLLSPSCSKCLQKVASRGHSYWWKWTSKFSTLTSWNSSMMIQLMTMTYQLPRIRYRVPCCKYPAPSCVLWNALTWTTGGVWTPEQDPQHVPLHSLHFIDGQTETQKGGLPYSQTHH